MDNRIGTALKSLQYGTFLKSTYDPSKNVTYPHTLTNNNIIYLILLRIYLNLILKEHHY